MTPTPLRAAMRVLACSTALACVPAAAHASTWTVDDDLAQCPNASFTSIQDAVDYAAPHDTILVCDGRYQESSTPLSGPASPSQPGSRNGLTIQKPLTIKGTGAAKVIIEPDPVLGDSLAGTAPYLRDGGGNVITIARQSLGSSDENENTVDISGVTVRSPYVYAEAGIAYFNTSGTVSASTVGPLRRANADETTSRPHGWGVIQTNFLQGTGGGTGTVRREVSVVDSLVTGYQAGGILFDGARGEDGTPESQARAGISQYGYVTGTKVVGGGSAAGIPQTGVKYFAGTRGAVTGSTIQDNTAYETGGSAYESYGVLLSDGETGPDPDNPAVRGLTVTGNALLRNRVGLFNADLAGTGVALAAPVLATGNYWGCSLGPVVGGTSDTNPRSASYGCQGISGDDAGTPPAASVEFDPFKATVPDTLVVPAATPDAGPSVSFREPSGPVTLKVGETINPVVLASDDFGVASVKLTAGGAPVATLTKAPYEFGWAPTAADAGKTVSLAATATDSSGQTTTATLEVKVAALPVEPPVPPVTPPYVPKPPVNTAPPVVFGDATVGETVTCVPGTWLADPTSFSYAWFRAGVPIFGAAGASYRLTEDDTASVLACMVTAMNVDGAVPALSTGHLVEFPTDDSGDEVERQVGPVLLSLSDTVKASTKTGKATLGEFTCVRALAKECTVTVKGYARIGPKRYSFKKVTVTGSGTKSLKIKLSSSARRALKKQSGTLSLRIDATDDTGFSDDWKTTASIKRR